MKNRKSKPSRNFWVLGNPGQLTKDAAQLTVGAFLKPRPGGFSEGVRIPDEESARVWVLSSGDYWAFWDTGNGWLASHGFADRICAEIGDAVQRIPIKSAVASLEEDFEILNFVGSADCFDHGRSDYVPGPLAPRISWARRIALCEHLLPSATIFRLEHTSYLILDDLGKAALMRAGIPEMYFDGELAFTVCGERSPIPQPPEYKDPYEGEKVRLTAEAIAELLRILRRSSHPKSAWAAVLAFCKEYAPDYPWSKLARPPLTRDIEEANEWLSAELHRLPDGGGLYLGLDTLNMRDGAGKNVELGVAERTDESDGEIAFTGGHLKMGRDFLIRGLVKMEKTYSEWAGASIFASYVVFLAYSGIVLSEALKRVFVVDPMRVAWGFHDGDVFLLGELELSGFVPRFR